MTTITPFDTPRLHLRPLSLDDVDDLVALDADPEVMRFIDGGRPTPRAEVVEIVGRTLDHRWSAADKATGQFVGWFALRPTGAEPIEGTEQGDVEYELRREDWSPRRS